MAQELVSPSTLIFTATLLAAFSGALLLVPRFLNASRGQLLATVAMLTASVLGLTGSVAVLLSGRTELFQLSWTLPFDQPEIGIDPLSAWFLLPIFLIPGCAALYARSYWHADNYPHNVRKTTFFFGLMSGFMGAVTVARDGITFLFAWEIMALAAYFLVATEDEKPEVSQAGTLYLITTHIGTLGLFALFSLLTLTVGTWLFPAVGSLDASSPIASALFLTALFGFGMKAGIMPFHIWLPSAHANAPSHVSAAMSGVILKVGIYGIIRTLSFFHTIPLWWGALVLLLGVVSGISGVAFAIGQHDLKRLLAYHSIENIGIIFMGIGVALIGQTIGSHPMVILGCAGALLHVLNHATFKALLFLGAGSVIHATGTREIDLMGGVARRLPYTALLFGVGAVAICGLPPLNGFVSELLIYLGFFRGIQESGVAAAATALAAPALAVVGGLAVACFVKVYGIVFLGAPRTEEHAAHHEAGWQMLAPMTVLALVCAVIGLAPALLGGLLQRATLTIFPLTAPLDTLEQLTSLAPLTSVSLMGVLLLVILGLLLPWYLRRLRSAPQGATVTWGCGYQRPVARMQYSASSFAELLTGLFAFVLKPQVHRPGVARGIFPSVTNFHSHVPEAVLELIYTPALERLYARFQPIRHMQNGILQQYVLYILITLVVLFLSDYL
ncbi:MAG: proton-conducting transporter membrane subunit [Desulfuromonadaceae bacterium]|nr:proton-conducting transporter membrane subunit [Desulfuromonadaceae bacterium]MDD5107340.1 proton-conducting transporter membrane subunit [Desulfuromonadaceae bacterium]